MLQVVAGLTVVFVGYVLYEVYKTVSSQSNSTPQAKVPPPAVIAAKPKPAPTVEPVATAAAAAPEPKKPAAEPEAAAAAQPKKPEAVAEESKAPHLKDPASGDAVPAPTNYRFAKKWIKEAMVAEGLLDKVYKNAELDEAAGRKVREALEKFKALPKYHA